MLSQLNESPKPRERRLFLVSLIPVVIGCSLHLLIAGITLSNRGVLAGSEYLTTVFAPQMIMFFIFYKRVVIPYMANGFENQIRFRSHTAILFITFLAVGFCSNIYFPGIEDRQPYWVSLLYWVFTAALGLVLIFSYNYVFHHERLKAKEALQQAERAKAEIDLLKRQINPHFLFNVMNNLYGLIEMRDNRASQLLSRLSKLLRYLLFDSSNPYVPLSKEQEMITDFLDLHAMSSSTLSDKVDFYFDGITDRHRIMPMLLINLVENCIKHSDIESNDQSWVRISMEVVDDQLHFQASNTFSPVTPKIEAGGFGLDNTRKLLEAGYAERFSLERKIDEHIYTVDLKLRLA